MLFIYLYNPGQWFKDNFKEIVRAEKERVQGDRYYEAHDVRKNGIINAIQFFEKIKEQRNKNFLNSIKFTSNAGVLYDEPHFMHAMNKHGVTSEMFDDIDNNLEKITDARVSQDDKFSVLLKVNGKLNDYGVVLQFNKTGSINFKTAFIDGKTEKGTKNNVDAWIKNKGAGVLTTNDNVISQANTSSHPSLFESIQQQLGIVKQNNNSYKQEADIYTPEVRAQMEAVRKKYEGTPQWMKAPNGEPTKLTEEQWLLVRTPNFKRWFGDWENVRLSQSIVEYLKTADSVKDLTGNEFEKSEVPLDVMVNKFYQDNYNNVVENPEIGIVKIDKRSVKDSIGHGVSRAKASAFAAVPEVIKNGKIFAREFNWKNRNYDSVCIAANIKINGVDYVCEVVVKQSEGRTGFYLHEVNIKKDLEGVFKTAINGTPTKSYSILAQYLAKVNTCSKVLDENGEPLVVYHGTDAKSWRKLR